MIVMFFSCRQTGVGQNTSSFWPPYRLPIDLTGDFCDLENALHSRHLHYLLFSLLSLVCFFAIISMHFNLSCK